MMATVIQQQSGRIGAERIRFLLVDRVTALAPISCEMDEQP